MRKIKGLNRLDLLLLAVIYAVTDIDYIKAQIFGDPSTDLDRSGSIVKYPENPLREKGTLASMLVLGPPT